MGEMVQSDGDPGLVIRLAGGLERQPAVLAHARRVAARHRHARQAAAGLGDPLRVLERLKQAQALAQTRLRPGEIALMKTQVARAGQRAGPAESRGVGARRVEQLRQPGRALWQMPAIQPVRPDRRRDIHTQRKTLVFNTPRQSCAKPGALRLEPVQPDSRISPAQLGVRLAGEGGDGQRGGFVHGLIHMFHPIDRHPARRRGIHTADRRDRGRRWCCAG